MISLQKSNIWFCVYIWKKGKKERNVAEKIWVWSRPPHFLRCVSSFSSSFPYETTTFTGQVSIKSIQWEGCALLFLSRRIVRGWLASIGSRWARLLLLAGNNVTGEKNRPKIRIFIYLYGERSKGVCRKSVEMKSASSFSHHARKNSAFESSV